MSSPMFPVLGVTARDMQWLRCEIATVTEKAHFKHCLSSRQHYMHSQAVHPMMQMPAN